MVQFLCDRCGCIMKPYDAARRICSHIGMTYAVLEDTPHKHIDPLWDDTTQNIDLCPDCKAAFDEWVREGKRYDN